MTDEEIQALQTELETTKREVETLKSEAVSPSLEEKDEAIKAAKEEVESLKTQLAERDAAFKPLREELAALKTEVASPSRKDEAIIEKDEALGVASASLEKANVRLTEVTEELTSAIGAYKALVLESNPDIPGELIKGETIKEIDSSLENTRAMVGKVRKRIEEELKRGTIPPGAPSRTAPDLSGMSAREKLQYALGKEQK